VSLALWMPMKAPPSRTHWMKACPSGSGSSPVVLAKMMPSYCFRAAGFSLRSSVALTCSW
jgi:hypothetical protein